MPSKKKIVSSKKSLWLILITSIIIIFGVLSLLYKVKPTIREKIPTINNSTNLKTYKNTLLNYEVGYPNNTSPFIPTLDERTLLEQGKLSIDKIKIIQFRDNETNSHLFSVSSRENPKKLSVEKFLEEECERIKAIPQEKGTKCPEGRYEYFEMNDGKKVLTEVIEWYASETKHNVVVRKFYYPLDDKIIIISFSTFEQGDKESLELQNIIMNSFKAGISY